MTSALVLEDSEEGIRVCRTGAAIRRQRLKYVCNVPRIAGERWLRERSTVQHQRGLEDVGFGIQSHHKA